LRDIAIANGTVPPPPNVTTPPPDEKSINAAFDDTPPEQLKAVGDAAVAAVRSVGEIEKLLNDRVGADRSADLSDLRATLSEMSNVVSKHMVRRGLAPAGGGGGGTQDAAAGTAVGSASGGSSGVASAQARGPASPGEIRSTQDVIAALDRICQFYAANEPSSPVPMLLKRARRLVSKSFLEIVRDLSPDALARLEIISGGDALGETQEHK
jgi:type VI secretion system protein ImpA